MNRPPLTRVLIFGCQTGTMADMRHAGRVALVTGGAQGIGRAIVERFLHEGARVCVMDLDGQAGGELDVTIDDRDRIAFFEGDVADGARVADVVEGCASRFGGLDILVNNAAIAHPYEDPLVNLDRAQWDRVLAVNLTGAMLCARASIPWLERRRGAIINIASTRALQSEPNCEAYAAAKGGLLALTHALAISLGPSVRVNAVSPGWIETRDWQKRDLRRDPDRRSVDHEQHPVGRVGTPHDVATMVTWLASDEAAFVTGQDFVVDGGMTRKMIYAD